MPPAAELTNILRRHLNGLPVIAQQGLMECIAREVCRRHCFSDYAGGHSVSDIAGFGIVMALRALALQGSLIRASKAALDDTRAFSPIFWCILFPRPTPTKLMAQ